MSMVRSDDLPSDGPDEDWEATDNGRPRWLGVLEVEPEDLTQDDLPNDLTPPVIHVGSEHKVDVSRDGPAT
jgi:hypothetical protein